MADAPRRRPAPQRWEVVRTEDLTPHLRRLVVTGPGIDAFLERDQGFTDRYVKLWFLHPDHTYPDPVDVDVVRATMPQEAWPVVRTYTVRDVDAAARELTIDFVVHGDAGVAGPWAATAAPGDALWFVGPGGAYRPSPDVDWHLLVGDDAALPAIAAALEEIPADVPVRAVLEVEGPDDTIELVSDGDLDVTWLFRGDAPPVALLDQAVREMPWPDGRVQAFVHGESRVMRTVRPFLLTEREVERDLLSVSAYWRSGETEEGFRAWKAEQNAAAAGQVA
ncbi:MAG: siderophore-interacting protein [Nocardioidaceae bacterium]|nr:siderophore-interacting protein [Nocardioidaceae bacterium]